MTESIKANMNDEKNEFFKTVNAYQLQGRVVELRILKSRLNKGRTVSGYYNNYNKAWEDIRARWKDETIYMSLQKLNPAILARADNRLRTDTTNCTSESDVQAYIFLHVDIDPKRPSGIQATDRERKYAKKMLLQVMEFLKNFRFTTPIISMSGNGYTADYYLEELPVNKENKELIKAVLETLDSIFSDDKASVDTSVCDPPRIIKLAGTISRKGDSLPDRPYTYSKIVKYPKVPEEVTKEKLLEIASLKKELA